MEAGHYKVIFGVKNLKKIQFDSQLQWSTKSIVAHGDLAVGLPGYFTRESTKPRGAVYPEKVQYKRDSELKNSE